MQTILQETDVERLKRYSAAYAFKGHGLLNVKANIQEESSVSSLSYLGCADAKQISWNAYARQDHGCQ